MTTGRVALAHLPTPLEPAERLGAALGMAAGALWVKRDDCTGLAGGGNKARKLEHLCAEARAGDADVLVTGGGIQSNHARMTAAAAGRLGLGCTLVLAGDPPAAPEGNVLLDLVLGAEVVWAGPLDHAGTEAAIDSTCERLRREGRRPFRIPVGGASVTGALAYVEAADELVGQLADVEVVVVADGSGGTHAGLVAGLGRYDRVLGVDVGARPDLGDAVPALAAATAARAGRPVPPGTPALDGDHVGAGYAQPTDDARRAVDLAARTEGLVLDPVYTGKAMAALIDARRDGRIGAATRTVFLHTGGMPALFASSYTSWAAQPPAT